MLPFKYSGGNADLTALAEGLCEEIVTGLSRFSYLRVVSRSSTQRYVNQTADVRTVGKEIGARYVMEGSLRQAGSQLRVSVQLVDGVTGAHLWAETYDRRFQPDQIFAMQDELIPRIVSTCADTFGVLARSISDAVRGKEPAQLSPYEALMRGFGYHHRLTPGEHAEARDALERAVEEAPGNADCWAMLSWIYSHEYGHGFNPRPGSLDRALVAARRAVDLAPSNHLALQALGVVLFFRKDIAGCLNAAERAMALNPLDGSNEAIFLITFAGDWDRGCALIERAMELNPHHPGWYRLMFSFNEYRKANYRAALDEAVKANVPEFFWTNVMRSAAHAQLGELEAARSALRDLLAQQENFADSARESIGKWMDPQLAAHLIEGLRKAGLEIGGDRVRAKSSRGRRLLGRGTAIQLSWRKPRSRSVGRRTVRRDHHRPLPILLPACDRAQLHIAIRQHGRRRTHGRHRDGRPLRHRREPAPGGGEATHRGADPGHKFRCSPMGRHLRSRLQSGRGVRAAGRPRPADRLHGRRLVRRSAAQHERSAAKQAHRPAEPVRGGVAQLRVRRASHPRRTCVGAGRPGTSRPTGAGYTDGWALLSIIHSEEYATGFNLQPDPLGRALQAAQRAGDAAPRMPSHTTPSLGPGSSARSFRRSGRRRSGPSRSIPWTAGRLLLWAS